MRRTLVQAVQNVIDNLDRDTLECGMRTSDGKIAVSLSALHKKVEARLERDGYTLGNVYADMEARILFRSKKRLEAVGELHSKSAAEAKDKVLEAAIKTFEKRDLFWELAGKLARKKGGPRYQPIIFTILTKEYLESKGVSFTDIKRHSRAAVVLESGRLKLAAEIYEKMEAKMAEHAPGAAAGAGGAADASARRASPPQPKWAAPEAHGRKPDLAVINLAYKGFEGGIGLATEIGGHGLDQAGIEKLAREIVGGEGAADIDVINAAAQVLNLAQRGVLDKYLGRLGDLRREAVGDEDRDPSPAKFGR